MNSTETRHFEMLTDIKSLENKEDLLCITYGVNIPVEYQSDVLKAILINQQGGSNENNN